MKRIGNLRFEESSSPRRPRVESRGKANNLGPSILQKAILVVEISLGRCGIANLAISQLGKLVEEGGENEHLKQTYKELYDSIKKTRIQNKDNSESLISQINQKSVENADLKAQIQEKVFANAALKNELRKLKGNIVDSKFAKASILGKPPLQPSRNHLVVRQPNAFTSERPRISRPRFASQVDEKNDLSKTVTPHYLPKVRESAAAKPHQVNAPNYSRNSHKESYGSNDMVHAYFLEDARKMTQDKTRIPSHKDMASTRAHCTPNACTPKPRNIYRSSPVSKCSGGMSNGEPLSSAVHEKLQTPRSCLRWKPTGRIFKTVSLRWIPTGKMFTDSTTKVDSEPPNGSNDDITNPYECNQTLYVSAGTSNSSAEQLQIGKGNPFSKILQKFAEKSNHPHSVDMSRTQTLLGHSLHQQITFYLHSADLGTSTHDAKTRRSLLHDNIVPKPDLALELGKSISLTKAEEEAVAREVHATHARIMSESEPEPIQRRQSEFDGRTKFLEKQTKKIWTKDWGLSLSIDEQWFDLSVDLLRKALAITPVIPAHPFELPPSGNTVIDFVNELGYPEPVEIVSNIRQKQYHSTPDSAVHHTGDDFILGNLKLSQKVRTDEVFGKCNPDPFDYLKPFNNLPYYPKYLKCVAKYTKKTPQESATRATCNKAGSLHAVKVKDHKRKQDSDDEEDNDDDEGPSARSNQGRSAKRRRPESAASGSAQHPSKDDHQSSKKPRESDASASKQHPALTSTGWQITDTRDDVVNSLMHMLPNNIQITDTNSFIVSKKRSSNSSKKLKGIQTLTPAEQEAADIMKALKESKKMSKRQPGTGGSNEGTGNILGVPDESTVISRASSEGTGSKKAKS
ncbi:hypothetical protein Tco_0828644 [Tanacetum coccineum]